MKKLLFSLAVIGANYTFGQITLDNSFGDNEYVSAYSKDETIYVSYVETDNKLKIYNADFSLRKIVNVPMPANYNNIWANGEGEYSVSKHVFNTDDKYEFLVTVTSSSEAYRNKLLLINEDGQIIKDFHPNAQTTSYRGYSEIFYDVTNNKNKLVIHNMINENYNEQFDVYSLPTSELTTKELESIKKLSAFPIPTNKTLTIFNPGNGANKVEIYDASGRTVVSKSFNINDSRVSIDVESLPKGTYVYKIGNVSSKFIKN